MRTILAGLLVGSLALQASAEIVSKAVEYRDGDAVLEGTVVRDDAPTGARPGLLIFHQWGGPSAYEQMRAEELARMGIVTFVADVYGKGVRPQDNEARGAESSKYRNDRPLMRSRARAALETLRAQEGVDPDRVAAMGFCFGGTVALELARDGAPLAGVVSVHGGLDTPTPADAANIKCRILALCGGDDPFVPAEQRKAFQDEMRAAHVDWEMIEYGGTVHAFTDPHAGDDPSRGVAYNEVSAKRAMAEVRRFLRETVHAGKAD